jgi:hypothetical protein
MSESFNQEQPETENSSGNSRANPPGGRHFFDDLASALRRGAEDARRATENAIPKVKSAAADGAYWAAYGLSFATVFEWTVLKQITPDCVKVGCGDGLKAGRQAAETWLQRMRQPKTEAAPVTPPQSGAAPAGPDCGIG